MSRTQLFEAIAGGSLDDIKRLIIKHGNLEDRDPKTGQTALMRAIDLQKIDVVELLFSYGAKINAVDLKGRSAIHYAMISGQISLLQILLVHKVALDSQDNEEWTPLHYAVDKNWFQAAEILIYLGADPRKQNKNKICPISMATEQRMKMILTVTSDSKRNTDIFFENSRTKIHLEIADITFGSKDDFAVTKIFFVHRKYQHNEITWGPKLKEEEELWTDVGRVFLSQASINATLEFRLAEKLKPSDELFVKFGDISAEQQESLVTEKEVDGEWMVYTTVRLSKNSWYALCYRVKTQFCDISEKACKVKSEVDENIEIDIPEGAFEEKGSLKLKIEPPAPVTSEEDSIISVSKYCEVSHSEGKQPKNSVTITMPLPESYSGRGQLVILSNSSGNDEDDWIILDVKPEIRQNKVFFMTQTFSSKVMVESKKGYDKTKLKRRVSRNFRHRKLSCACFFVFAKAAGTNHYDAIIECTNSKTLKKRLKSWEAKQYSCLRVSGMFKMKSGQRHKINISGNIRSEWDIRDISLVYLRAGHSYQSLELRVKNPKELHSGTIKIEKYVSKNLPQEVLTYLPLVLDEKAFRINSSVLIQKAISDIGVAEDLAWISSPLKYKMIPNELTTVLQECMASDSWKLWVYLGLPTTILTVKIKDTDRLKLYRLMMEKWFEKNSSEADYGITALMSGFQKMKNMEAISIIKDYLRKCKTSTESREYWNGKPFLSWLDGQMFDDKAPVIIDESEPMSDAFLVDIVTEHSLDEMLFIDLLSSTTVHSITSDTASIKDCQYKRFLMLLKFRSQHAKKEDAFKQLLDTLQIYKHNDTKECIIKKATQWTKKAPRKKKKSVEKLNPILS